MISNDFRFKLAAIALIAVNSFSVPAFAQDAEKVTAAKAFASANGSLATMESLMPQILEGMQARFNRLTVSMHQTQEKMAPLDAQKLADTETKQVFDRFKQLLPQLKMKEELEKVLVAAYTKHFGTDQLKALTSFYSSPVGAKYVTWNSGTVEIIPKYAAEIQPYIKKLVEEVKTGTPAGEFVPVDHTAELKAIPPARLELIRKIFDESGSKKVAGEGFGLSFAEGMKSNEAMVENDSARTPEQKKEMIDGFRKLTDLVIKRVDAYRAAEPFLITSMNGAFNDDDLNALLQFFKEPMTKQAFSQFPDIQKEAMLAWNADVDPKMTALLQQAISETVAKKN